MLIVLVVCYLCGSLVLWCWWLWRVTCFRDWIVFVWGVCVLDYLGGWILVGLGVAFGGFLSVWLFVGCVVWLVGVVGVVFSCFVGVRFVMLVGSVCLVLGSLMYCDCFVKSFLMVLFLRFFTICTLLIGFFGFC